MPATGFFDRLRCREARETNGCCWGRGGFWARTTVAACRSTSCQGVPMTTRPANRPGPSRGGVRAWPTMSPRSCGGFRAMPAAGVSWNRGVLLTTRPGYRPGSSNAGLEARHIVDSPQLIGGCSGGGITLPEPCRPLWRRGDRHEPAAVFPLGLSGVPRIFPVRPTICRPHGIPPSRHDGFGPGCCPTRTGNHFLLP